MILIQISLAKFTNGFFQEIPNIFYNQMMNALLESNFSKHLSNKLIGTMTAEQFSQIFVSVLDETFDSLF